MIGIYTRVSTDSQAQLGFSLEIQRKKGIAFAQKQGQEYELFEDAGISGGTLDREQFQRMLLKIKEGEIDIVWVISKDRLTRASLSEALSLRDFLISHNVRLYIDGSYLPFSSPEDLLQSNILDSIAEFQRLLIKKKTTEGRHKQIDEGKQTYCMIYGYDFRYLSNGKKEWYVNEDEAEMIRYIYDLYFQDLNFDDICRKLYSDGYKTKRKGDWDRGTIHNILRRPEYVGLTKNTKGELIPSVNYAPIVDKDVWERVQRTIDGKIKFRQGKFFRSAAHELSGILTCSTCGAKHFYHTARGRRGQLRPTYSHRKIKTEEVICKQHPLYFNANIAEYLMRVLFIRTFNDRASVRAYMMKLEESLSKDTDKIRTDIKRVQKSIDELNIERKRLVDGVRKGVFVDDDVRDDLNDIRNQIERQTQSIQSLKNELTIKSERVQTVIDAFAEDVVANFLSADAKKKREMYIKYCSSIQTDGYDIVVEFITGNSQRINTRGIPEDLIEEMVMLLFIDEHPEYAEVAVMLNRVTQANRSNEEEWNADSINSLAEAFPDQSFYEHLNGERIALRDKFILKTKGRPRKVST